MNPGVEYIKYQWKAKRRHGLPSSFIYDLTANCFELPISDELSNRLQRLNTHLRDNTDTIEITDFGAGSKKMGNRRVLKDIYKTSSSKGKYGKMLYQLVNHYKPNNVLEFGTSMGIGAVCLASGNTETKVITVEGCPNTFAVGKANIERVGAENVEAINSTFDDYIDALTNEQFDLVFIDGHHNGEALLRYLTRLKPFTHNDTIFVLDDIRWSDSMLNAWNEIIAQEELSVTIDVFRMGIVIPKPNESKEHFVTR